MPSRYIYITTCITTHATDWMFEMKIFRSNECYIHQARSYLYVKCAAVYTFSSQREYFKMFKSARKTWPNYRGNLQQVKSNITKLIDFISDNVCDCSISWHYSVIVRFHYIILWMHSNTRDNSWRSVQSNADRKDYCY